MRLDSAFGTITLVVGIAAILTSTALTVRCYMPCPFGDQWFVLNSIARGAGPSSWQWLFGQHNEHRIAIPRLLIWMDLAAFQGKNVSLFIEIYSVLLLHWAAVCYALKRSSEFSKPLKRTLQGLYAFCIFHPNQSENLTWPFEISFVLSFAAGSIALLAMAFFFQVRRRWLTVIAATVAQSCAALSLAGGLLAAPVALCLALIRRVPFRYVCVIFTFGLVGLAAYFWGFRLPEPAHSPKQALADPKGIFVYVLTYFGASWTRILPHKERAIAFISILCFIAVVIRSMRQRDRLSSFEWFCIAECSLMLGGSVATALVRLTFGTGQAYASRYQTPAMLYWGALCALVMIAVWRVYPKHFGFAQGILLFVLLLSVLSFSKIWKATSTRADTLRVACRAVMNGTYGEGTERTLDASKAGVEPGASMLRKLWRVAPE